MISPYATNRVALHLSPLETWEATSTNKLQAMAGTATLLCRRPVVAIGTLVTERTIAGKAVANGRQEKSKRYTQGLSSFK